MEPVLEDVTTTNEEESIIPLSEVHALKVKCALLEFQLLKQTLETKLEEGLRNRDKILDPIFAQYRGTHTGNIGFDPNTGSLILEKN